MCGGETAGRGSVRRVLASLKVGDLVEVGWLDAGEGLSVGRVGFEPYLKWRYHPLNFYSFPFSHLKVRCLKQEYLSQ